MLAVLERQGRKEGRIHTSREANEKDSDQKLSGKAGIVGKSPGRRHHHHLQQIGGSQENGKKNVKISNGGKRSKYSLSDPSTLKKEFLHGRSFFEDFACRHWRLWCKRREVKTAHVVRVTQAHISLVLCTRHSRAGHIIDAHAFAQEHVDCLFVSACSSKVRRSSHVSSYTT